MDETEEIDEFVESNNLLATLGRPQLQHGHSIELLSWYASNIIVLMFIQGMWNHWSHLPHAIEGPILNALWHSLQGNFGALGPGFISTEPLSISSSWMILDACVLRGYCLCFARILVMFKVMWYCKGYFLAFNHVFCTENLTIYYVKVNCTFVWWYHTCQK